MTVIGLTGGIGSGKSAAASLFAALGVPVVDTDKIAHELTGAGQPALQAIARQLGDETILPDGSLNRPLVRQLVFSHPEKRRQLEAILHPLIRERARAMLSAHPEVAYQILMVPLLFETRGYDNLIQRSLVIDCEEALQIKRTMARSQLGESDVRAILGAQLPRAARLKKADDVIENNGSLDELAEKVRQKHEKYINTCAVS